MTFELPALPYDPSALEPVLSRETLGLHHGQHHARYVSELNRLVQGTRWENHSLEDIVREAKEPELHDNAAQAWNHEFYWRCMSPSRSAKPPEAVETFLARYFDSSETLRQRFLEQALAHFGSGWMWIVERAGRLTLEATHDAGCPLELGAHPVLACDLWEHAYYVDYQNRKEEYLQAWWSVVDWEAFSHRLHELSVDA